jgi:hypothetical protein
MGMPTSVVCSVAAVQSTAYGRLFFTFSARQEKTAELDQEQDDPKGSPIVRSGSAAVPIGSLATRLAIKVRP